MCLPSVLCCSGFVHRCGRTARIGHQGNEVAGDAGCQLSLVVCWLRMCLSARCEEPGRDVHDGLPAAG